MLHWLFRRARRPTDDEIARELRDHLELEADSLRDAADDATTAARRRFGNLGATTENVRAVWRWIWLEELGHDIRIGSRGLRRSPAYTLAAAAVLALGIGGATAVFSLGYHMLRDPYPALPQHDLVWLSERVGASGGQTGISPAGYLALRGGLPAVSALAIARPWSMALTAPDGSRLVDGFLVSADFFSAIGARFALGHGFSADADSPGHDGVVVFSHRFWRERFNASLGVLDSVVYLNGMPRRVVGVLAPGIEFPEAADTYGPIAFSAANRVDFGGHQYDGFARLAPHVTREDLDRQLAVASRRLAVASPATDSSMALQARPATAYHTDDARPLLGLFDAAALLVLLAACASASNLALARATSRRRDMAVRGALGGRRARLVRHVLVEALLVSFLAAIAALGLAAWGVRVALSIVPSSMANYVPGSSGTKIDGAAIAFALIVCVVTTIVFACVPAFRAAHPDLPSVLSDGGRGSIGDVRGARLRSLLVILEVSVALVLVSGSVLLTRSVRNMLGDEVGIRLDDVLTLQLSLGGATTDSSERVAIRSLMQHVRATPGVVNAGLTSTTPLSNSAWGVAVEVPGHTSAIGVPRFGAIDERVTSGYFRTMGIRILAGRAIEDHDTFDAPNVVVISASLRHRVWGNEDPIGEVMHIDGQTWRVVGVASEVRHGGLDEPVQPEIYRPVDQAPEHLEDLEVWTSRDPKLVLSQVIRAIGAADPAIAVGEATTMRDMQARHVSPFRFMADVIDTFALVTLAIAIVGIYGTIAYGVAQRTREIGIRLALGATARRIVWSVTRSALELAGVGAAIGLVGTFAFAQLMRSMLYGVSAADPGTPLAVAVGILALAAFAAFVPAWRASCMSPTAALRD